MEDPMEAVRIERALTKLIRFHFALSCPICRKERPRGNPTKLLPHEQCRVDGYVDWRPAMTTEQFLDILS